MTYPGRAEARVELRRLLEAARALVKRRQPASDPGEVEKREAEKKLTALFAYYFARQSKKAAAKLRASPPAKQKATAEWWNDEAFWEDDDFVVALVRLIMDATVAGAALLPDMIGLSLDLSAVNKEAMRAARDYVYDLVKNITDTSKQAIRDAVTAFVETPGMTLGDVIDRLPFNEQRAALIATTEITRAYATGQAAAGAALAEQFPDVRVVKEWFTSVDDAVCPVCGPLHTEEVDEGELFGGEFDGPPAHPGCRCWVSYRTRING